MTETQVYHLFRDLRLKLILRKHKPFYSGNGVSKTQEFLMKMAQFISITLVIILGMFLNTCGQMRSNDEGMGSKSIEEASGSSDDTTTTTDTTAPTVSSTSPSDSDTSVSVSSSISVTFSESMDTTSVTANSSGTSCFGVYGEAGTLQVSTDSFSTCILMNSSLTVSNSNKTFAVTPIKPILMRNNFPLTYYAKQTISIRRIEPISIITSTIHKYE